MTTIGWDRINAYVDRELDAADAAVVAAEIARDPALAARVATLTRLKAETAAQPPLTDLPPIPQASRRPRQPAAWATTAIAASLAALVAVGSTAWLSRAPAADPVAATVTAESGWLSGESPDLSRNRVQVAVATEASDGLPDLSAAELRLAYLAADPAAEARRGVFAGYVGPNGCRLGLWIGRSDGTVLAPEARDVGGVRVRAWSEGGRAFALMSATMDGERLTRLGEVVADLTRRGSRPDERLRVALQGAARAGAPCVG